MGRAALFIGAFLALSAALISWYFLARAPVLRVRDDAPQDTDRYTLNVVMHEAEGTCAVTESITFKNRTGRVMDHTVLRFFLNAFSREDTCPFTGTDLYDRVYPEGFSPGGVSLQGIRLGDAAAESAFLDAEETALKVYTGALAPGEECTLSLNYVLTLPLCRCRCSRSGDLWLLGGAFAVLSVYDEASGAYRTDPYAPVGDPFVADTAAWDITVRTAALWRAAASCEMTEADGVWRGAHFIGREMALVLYRDRAEKERTFGDVHLRTLVPKDGDRILSGLAGILDVYQRTYGACPWDSLTVVSAPIPVKEFTFPGLIILSEDLFSREDGWELTLAHAAAHQWFYGLAGCDRCRDPWQDGALCRWAVLTWAGQRYGIGAREQLMSDLVDMPMRERVYGGVTPGSPLDRFPDPEVFETVACGRGAAYLAALDTCTGGGTDRILAAYIDRTAWKRASRQDFEDLIGEWTGKDLTEMTADYLDTLME